MDDLSLHAVLTYVYTFADNSEPALNFATFLALILIAAPVRGFRPILAALLDTENVPKPTRTTLSPFFNAFPTAPVNELIAAVACFFEIPTLSAIFSTNSALFIFCNYGKSILFKSSVF